MKRKNIKTTSFLGTNTQLVQRVKKHWAVLTDKGVPVDKILDRLDTYGSAVQATEQGQADAKTGLKNATQVHVDTVAKSYPEFSSVIDLLRGAVGNHTALGRQLTNIRKAATRRSGRSASNVVEVNTDAQKAA